jgi:hypothetical protein
MVKEEISVYLFIGQDSFSKAVKLKNLKAEFLPPEIEKFNFDLLYAKDLNLAGLQERLLSLPLKTKKRIIVIKNAQDLKQEIKDFILRYVKKPYPAILLVLDIDSASMYKAGTLRQGSKDEFVRNIARYSETLHFREEIRLDTFNLGRQIELRRADYALRVLNQLLENGERPERILGGLRYSWLKGITSALELRKRIRLLLKCDLDIKTGKLKPEFALEKLVVNLCCF